jgi:hypothetical protein
MLAAPDDFGVVFAGPGGGEVRAGWRCSARLTLISAGQSGRSRPIRGSGTGKSTSITQLGRKHQIETERRHPGLAGRIPVAYITVPPAATPKTMAIEFAAFLGLPVSSRDS